MFSVKIVWIQEVVTERDKIGKLFTNQIVKNAQELTTGFNNLGQVNNVVTASEV